MWDQMKTRLHHFVIGIFLFVVNFYILMTQPQKINLIRNILLQILCFKKKNR